MTHPFLKPRFPTANYLNRELGLPSDYTAAVDRWLDDVLD